MEFAETKGGREIANHALRRAEKVFLKVLISPLFAYVNIYCFKNLQYASSGIEDLLR